MTLLDVLSANIERIQHPSGKTRAALRIMWFLLLLPFIGLLWVPLYNFAEPHLLSLPFFYWYQFAWVPISSFLVWLVYRSRSDDVRD